MFSISSKIKKRHLYYIVRLCLLFPPSHPDLSDAMQRFLPSPYDENDEHEKAFDLFKNVVDQTTSGLNDPEQGIYQHYLHIST